MDWRNRLAEIDAEAQAYELATFGIGGPQQPTREIPEIRDNNGMPLGDRLNELIRLFQAQPILLPPVLAWAQQKHAEIEFAKLSALYTPDQIEEMRRQLDEGEST